MSDAHDVERCDFCKHGRVTRRNQSISFRQWTDKGYVFCRAEIPIGVCDRCGEPALACSVDDDCPAMYLCPIHYFMEGGEVST